VKSRVIVGIFLGMLISVYAGTTSASGYICPAKESLKPNGEGVITVEGNAKVVCGQKVSSIVVKSGATNTLIEHDTVNSGASSDGIIIGGTQAAKVAHTTIEHVNLTGAQTLIFTDQFEYLTISQNWLHNFEVPNKETHTTGWQVYQGGNNAQFNRNVLSHFVGDGILSQGTLSSATIEDNLLLEAGSNSFNPNGLCEIQIYEAQNLHLLHNTIAHNSTGCPTTLLSRAVEAEARHNVFEDFEIEESGLSEGDNYLTTVPFTFSQSPTDIIGVPTFSSEWQTEAKTKDGASVGIEFPAGKVENSAGAAEWLAQAPINPSGAKEVRLNATSCVSASGCAAVGEYVNSSNITVPLAEHWNGEKWITQAVQVPSGAKTTKLSAVSCFSSTSCTAVGEYVNSPGAEVTLAENLNGEKWSVQETPNPSAGKEDHLHAVSCTSVTTCTAVAEYHNSAGTPVTLAERLSGGTWVIQETPNPSGALESHLQGVSCGSSSECMAVGEYKNSSGQVYTLAERWTTATGKWAIQETQNRSGATGGSYLKSVSCSSATCTAVGYEKREGTETKTLAERWSGVEWAIQATVNPSGAKESFLYGVSCISATECSTTGYDSQAVSGVTETLMEGVGGSEWAIQSSPNPTGAKGTYPVSISCDSTTQCVAVGKYVTSTSTTDALGEVYK
jgi:hypothetical protein